MFDVHRKGSEMKSNTLNLHDLAVLKEISPMLRLRLGFSGRASLKSRAGRNLSTLVVMPCAVGDSLSYLPALRAFVDRNLAPVDVVVSPEFRSLAERVKGVRRVYIASSSYNRMSEQLNRLNQPLSSDYDQIVILRLSQQAFDLIKHIRGKRVVSSDATLLRYVLHVAKSSLLNRSVVQSREVMFEVFGLEDVAMSNNVYELFDDTDEGPYSYVSLPVINCEVKKVLVHTGSGWNVKRWSDENWVELLGRVNEQGDYRFFFVGKGEEERSSFERIQQRLDFYVHSLIDSVNLWELFQIMKMSDFFIGIDSGPRNLAHYANLRSITLLNPAAVKNFTPLDNRDIVVEKPNRIRTNIVNVSKGASLNRISVDEVYEAFGRLTASLGQRQKVAKLNCETSLSVAS